MRTAILVPLIAAAMAAPAGAIELKTSPTVGGSLTVTPDFTACGSLLFPGNTAFVGQLTAVGTLQGPGTKVGTVRGAIPIVGVGSWNGCINGPYGGATVGDGKFSLSASSSDGDFVDVKQCVVNNGALTCF